MTPTWSDMVAHPPGLRPAASIIKTASPEVLALPGLVGRDCPDARLGQPWVVKGEGLAPPEVSPTGPPLLRSCCAKPASLPRQELQPGGQGFWNHLGTSNIPRWTQRRGKQLSLHGVTQPTQGQPPSHSFRSQTEDGVIPDVPVSELGARISNEILCRAFPGTG